MSLLAELQRRKVFKVGAAYLVVGWLLIQIAATLIPYFAIPGWTLRLVTLLVLLGFPLALVMAWMFDVTPEGLQAAPAPVGNKRVFAISAGLVALAIAWYFYAQPAIRRGDAALPAAAIGLVKPSVDPRSIAVLPFLNMSSDKDNEYFSDGISEEILNVLARTPALQVAARTSSFSFKGGHKEVPEIARELNVRMVLEGSVRKQGDQVRITAQLIDASNGFHVWSQTYDRKLKDIFAIQDEIANAIAGALKLKLSPAGPDNATAANTADMKAYDLYLKGLSLWQARGEKNLRAAEADFRAALARDPNYAKAWAGLAITYVALPDWSGAPRAATYALATDAALRALALDRDLPEPYAVLGVIAGDEFRFATARAMFTRALALAPSYATGYQWFGDRLRSEGDLDTALVMARKGATLDPKSPIVRGIYAYILSTAGRDDEALAVCAGILADAPDWLDCSLLQFDVAVTRKDFATARSILQQLATQRGPEALRLAQEMSDALEGKGDLNAVAEQLLPLPDGIRYATSQTPLGSHGAILYFMALGRNDLAIQRYAREVSETPRDARSAAFDSHYATLHCDPKFQDILRSLKVEKSPFAARCAKAAK